MNRKAFTLIELLATIVIIALIMGLILPSAMRVSRENKDKMCDSYQEMMEEYAAVSPLKDNYFIELDELDELTNVKQDCDGYVFVDHSVSPMQYKAYLVCNNGCSTDGYNPEIGSTKEHVVVPSCKVNVIYNGQYQELVAPSQGPSNKYILSNNLRKDVGTQNVQVDLSDKRIYSWEDDSQDYKVVRKCGVVPREIILTAKDLKFTYLQQPPPFEYKLDGTIEPENPLAEDVTFKVYDENNQEITVRSNTDAGTYTIVPSSSVTSNYTLKPVNGTLTIERAVNPITVTTPQSWSTVYTTSVQNKTFTAATNAQGAVTYSIASQKDNSGADVDVFSIPTPSTPSLRLAAGATAKTYTVKIKASAEGNRNYLPGDKEIVMTVVVDKARFTCSTRKDNYNYASTMGNPSVSSNPGTGNVTYYYSTSNTTSGGTAWSGITSTSLDVGTYYLYAKVDPTTNYYDATCSAVKFVISKGSFTCSTSKADYTYNGTIGSPSVSSNPGKGTVTYYYNTSDSTSGGSAWATVNSTSLNARSYYIFAKIDDTKNYNGATCSTGSFTVKKAAASNEVKITGTNTWGQTLTATITTNSDGAKGYQWYSNSKDSTSGGTKISGATSSTYTIDKSLVDKYIYVVASVGEGTNWNAANNSTDKTDASTNTTAKVARKSSSMTLASTKTLTYPTAGTESYTYDGDGTVSCSSANESYVKCSLNTSTKVLTLTPVNVTSSAINVTLSAAEGTYYLATSKTIKVTVNPGTLSGSVKITGTNTWGNTLTASVTNTDSASLTYKWYYTTKSGATSGGTAVGDTNCNTGSTCVIPKSLVGKYIYVEVGASKTNYTSTTWTDATDATANTTAAVAKRSASMTLAGTKTLTYPSNGTESYSYDGDGTVSCSSANESYVKCSVNTSTKVLTLTPVNKTSSAVNVTLSATEGTYYLSASKTIKVTVNPGTLSGSVTITGTNTWGSTLTASVTNTNSASLTYKWYYTTTAGATSGGTAVGDTKCNTGSTCVIPKSLVGKYIYVEVGASKTNYTSTTWKDVTDDKIGKQAGTNAVSISGTLKDGQKLTATISTNSDGTKGYQWYSNSNNNTSNGTAISGATSSTYTISKDYVGKYIYVAASVGDSTYYTTPGKAYAITSGKIENSLVSVAAPTTASCTSATYNNTDQTLFDAHTSGGYTNDVLKGRGAGDYTVTLSLQSGYKWSDGTTANKTLTCSIGKADGSVSVKSWNDVIQVKKQGNTYSYDKKFTKNVVSTGAVSCSSSSTNTTCTVTNAQSKIIEINITSTGTKSIVIESAESDNYKKASITKTIEVPSKVFYVFCGCTGGSATATVSETYGPRDGDNCYDLGAQDMCKGSSNKNCFPDPRGNNPYINGSGVCAQNGKGSYDSNVGKTGEYVSWK